MQFGGGMPGGPGGPGGAQKPSKPQIPKLLDDNNGKNKLCLMVNNGYKLFWIVRNFVNKSLFFGAWVTVLFMFPMGFCYYEEQLKIMMKLQANMIGEGGMPPGM